MPETVPLTKSQRNHLDNLKRRDANRRRQSAKQDAKVERDEKIKAVNNEFEPKIRKLQEDRQKALVKIWNDWRATRAIAE